MARLANALHSIYTSPMSMGKRTRDRNRADRSPSIELWDSSGSSTLVVGTSASTLRPNSSEPDKQAETSGPSCDGVRVNVVDALKWLCW